jgi:anaerobic ribonucleoside-triphosphate reductase
MVKTKTEVYSRVCGFLRPVEQWNDGKVAEFHDRSMFTQLTETNL